MLPKMFRLTERRFEALATLLEISDEQQNILRQEMGFPDRKTTGETTTEEEKDADKLAIRRSFLERRNRAWKKFGGLPEHIDI